MNDDGPECEWLEGNSNSQEGLSASQKLFTTIQEVGSVFATHANPSCESFASLTGTDRLRRPAPQLRRYASSATPHQFEAYGHSFEHSLTAGVAKYAIYQDDPEFKQVTFSEEKKQC